MTLQVGNLWRGHEAAPGLTPPPAANSLRGGGVVVSVIAAAEARYSVSLSLQPPLERAGLSTSLWRS